MTNSNNKQAVAVKTRINAGGGIYKGLQQNHNETVAVKTRVNAGRPSGGINHNETVAVKTRVNAGLLPAV